MEVVEAYKPICCSKAFLRRDVCLRHEKNCPHNRNNKACATCKFLDTKIDENVTDIVGTPVKARRCTRKNVTLGTNEPYQMHCPLYKNKDGLVTIDTKEGAL